MDNPPAQEVLDNEGIANVDSFVPVTNGSSLEIKYAIVQSWPVVIGVPVYWSDWQDGDITDPHEGEQPAGYHAITIVAYDDATERFRFANSWGTNSFGDAGFGTLS